jgi:hypothetical protein
MEELTFLNAEIIYRCHVCGRTVEVPTYSTGFLDTSCGPHKVEGEPLPVMVMMLPYTPRSMTNEVR